MSNIVVLREHSVVGIVGVYHDQTTYDVKYDDGDYEANNCAFGCDRQVETV